jgi:hypothetical protein
MGQLTPSYKDRNAAREQALDEATMNLVAYYMGLGDDLATAQDKVGQISDEVAPWIYSYVKGRTSKLIAELNAIDEVTYPFFDSAAKAKIVGDLTITT